MPPTIHATAIDSLNLSATATDVTATTAGSQSRTITRSLLQNRIAWGTTINPGVLGPQLQSEATPVWLGITFYLDWAVNCIGCRIYKHPDLAGTIPIALFDPSGNILAQTTVTWVADSGGWRTITFPASAALAATIANTTNFYTLAYCSVNSKYVSSRTIWEALDYELLPFDVVPPGQDVNGNNFGGGVFNYAAASPVVRPPSHNDFNYYVDPIVQWNDIRPSYRDRASYFSQWTNSPGYSSFAFPLAVFFADPPDIAGYKSHGVNTLIAGSASADYKSAIVAAVMDHWPAAAVSDDPDQSAVINVLTDSAYGARVRGYYIGDEPDLTLVPLPPLGAPGYRTPTIMQQWSNLIKSRDSTRPQMLGLSNLIGINGAYYGYPSNLNMALNARDWRTFANIVDVLSGDFYTLGASTWNQPGGPWTYANYVGRLREVNDDRTPVWCAVETNTISDVFPMLDSNKIHQAIWAALIAGARGIILFDHYFGASGQDDAYILRDARGATTLAMVQSLSTLLQTLGPALMSLDLGLVTDAHTDNTTAGPLGGVYGVPLHYTTRYDGVHHYLFVMSIRPAGGASSVTGTITIPSIPNTTLTVIGESRTVVTNGSGVFQDNFTSDYTIHLYQW